MCSFAYGAIVFSLLFSVAILTLLSLTFVFPVVLLYVCWGPSKTTSNRSWSWNAFTLIGVRGLTLHSVSLLADQSLLCGVESLSFLSLFFSCVSSSMRGNFTEWVTLSYDLVCLVLYAIVNPNNICMIFIQYLRNISNIFAQYLHNICKYLYNICIIFAKFKTILIQWP